MIHGIYVKNKPKGKWHLFSLSLSAEGANLEKIEAVKQAKSLGNEQAEAAIQIYESHFYIPEVLSNLVDQKPLYN